MFHVQLADLPDENQLGTHDGTGLPHVLLDLVFEIGLAGKHSAVDGLTAGFAVAFGGCASTFWPSLPALVSHLHFVTVVVTPPGSALGTCATTSADVTTTLTVPLTIREPRKFFIAWPWSDCR